MFGYLKKFFDTTDPTASLRHAMFALVMIAGVLYLGAELVVGLVKRGTGMSGDWNVGFGILASATTGAKIAGKAPAPKADDDDQGREVSK